MFDCNPSRFTKLTIALLTIFVIPAIAAAQTAKIIPKMDHSEKEMLLPGYIQNKYSHEWRKDTNDQPLSPKQGLALSGGGVRSAAFSIGAMQALSSHHLNNKMHDFDLMSSVSGGSYALSWYYIQNMLRNSPTEDIFDRTHQDYLENNGNYLTHAHSVTGNMIEMVPKFLVTVLSAPFHIFANGIMDWDVNLSPMRWFYENGLEREFMVSSTNKDQVKYYLGLIPTGARNPVTFQQLDNFLQKKGNNLPFPIINTTADIRGEKNELQRNKRINQMFEFTPMWYGSDYFGYRNDFPVTLNRSVSISGAAADSSNVTRDKQDLWSKTISLLWSASNLDLGYYLTNQSVPEKDRIIHNFLPVPLYFFDGVNRRDHEGTAIYLSDGGQSENLGALSLIRRGVKSITIIDGEHNKPVDNEPTQFESLEILQKELKDTWGLHLILEGQSNFKVHYAPNPVLEGKIVRINEKGEKETVVDVTYVKLSIDKTEDTFSQYDGCAAIGNYKKKHSTFPQMTTADQFFSEAQFRAFRELGYYNVMKHYVGGVIKCP